MHDIRYNPVADEIVVPNPFSNAILTFRGGATEQEAPIRIIQGPNTQLTGPDTLDIDVVNREIFVPGGGGMLVFPLDANGDVPPKRVIRGPDTQLGGGGGGHAAVDPLNNLLAVTGRGGILIFDRAASGNVKPLRTIRGPNTYLEAISQMAIYPPTKTLVVTMDGPTTALEWPRVFVGLWSLDDDGDVPPKWAIHGEMTLLKRPLGVALDPEHKELYVSDMRLNAVLAFSVPEIFEPVAR
jgi:DNA-binding beta-propeller fold protein YncE